MASWKQEVEAFSANALSDHNTPLGGHFGRHKSAALVLRTAEPKNRQVVRAFLRAKLENVRSHILSILLFVRLIAFAVQDSCLWCPSSHCKF